MKFLLLFPLILPSFAERGTPTSNSGSLQTLNEVEASTKPSRHLRPKKTKPPKNTDPTDPPTDPTTDPPTDPTTDPTTDPPTDPTTDPPTLSYPTCTMADGTVVRQWTMNEVGTISFIT